MVKRSESPALSSRNLPCIISVWRRVFCMTVDSEFEEEYSDIRQQETNVSNTLATDMRGLL